MKRFSKGLLLMPLAAGLLISSCASESPWESSSSGEGTMTLSLSALTDVEAAVPAVRAVSTEIITPPVSDFKIKVSKIDGSYSKTFSSEEEFGKNEKFPVGAY